MTHVRTAAVSGMFYDADPRALRGSVASYVQAAAGEHAPEPLSPKAIIAPHAGFVYSGPVAGHAYAALRPVRGRIERVVLLGPAHRVYTAGIAASTADAFATPLGEVQVDQAALRRVVSELDFVEFSDAAHAKEHSLEVQLPFLQEVLGHVTILPFAVGDASAGQVALLLERLWGGEETLIVISSDLSHYRSYDDARRIDRITSDQILRLAPGGLTGEHACGYRPIGGLLRAAVSRGLVCRLLDLRSSGDTAGPRDRVVGYGAYAFYAA